MDPSSPAGQFEAPYGTAGPTTTFTIPALRYMKEYGLTHEQLAYVAVAQRQWAAKNPGRCTATSSTLFAILEGVRQIRGEAAAQVAGPDISVVLGNGGMFASCGVLVLGKNPR
jgi:hypothetical protein